LTPSHILSVVGQTPHTPPERGRMLYDFLVKHRLSRCLELGFAHGVGTVWIGGAVQALGGGKVIAVDVENALKRTPSAKDLTAKAGLQDIVELNYDPISYTWHLKRKLDEYRAEPFDFIFIDGAHTWDTDGLAFFLADMVLRPGGWLLFDDLDWSYASSPTLLNTEFVRSMTPEARKDRQVRAVWERLVLQHPGFGNFLEDGGWGWAQKTGDTPTLRQLEIRRTSPSLPERILRKAVKRFR
jgi:predicted O-methyltransferase YrrM